MPTLTDFFWLFFNESTNSPEASDGEEKSELRAVWKSRWTSWAPVPNKPTISVDVKQHFSFRRKPFWAWLHWVFNLTEIVESVLLNRRISYCHILINQWQCCVWSMMKCSLSRHRPIYQRSGKIKGHCWYRQLKSEKDVKRQLKII